VGKFGVYCTAPVACMAQVEYFAVGHWGMSVAMTLGWIWVGWRVSSYASAAMGLCGHVLGRYIYNVDSANLMVSHLVSYHRAGPFHLDAVGQKFCLAMWQVLK